jgi:ABC-2 type transport system permease protein
MTGLLRSEWTKIYSVRSTVWTLLTAVVVMLGLGAIISGATAGLGDRAALTDPTTVSLAGAPFAAVVVASLGVLLISGEYRTGMIRTTLVAVPRRLRMLAAKTAVFAAVAFGVSLVMSFASFFVGQALLGEKATALDAPGVLRSVVGCALYIAAGGLFGLALGTLVRHTAGGIVAVVLLTLVLPQMTALLPGGWGATVRMYFTTNAGQQILRPHAEAGQLDPWAGFGVYCAWIAITLLAAAVLLRRRDA